MINSVEEFIRLRESDIPEEYHRSAYEMIAPDVVDKLMKEHHEMKEWVIHNKLVTVEVLERLSKDDDSEVREGVANKRKCSLEIFQRLSVDEDYLVRCAIVNNPKVPFEVLEKMLEDEDEFVLVRVKERLSGWSSTQ